MSLRQQIHLAARGSFLLRIASLVLSMLSSIVLARALGAHEYGIYSFAFSLITLLAIPAQAGIPTLLVRETAKFAVKDDLSAMKGVWWWSTKFILTTSACAIGVAVAYVLSQSKPETRIALWIGLPLIPLIALGNARGAALRGLRRLVLGQIPENIIRPALLIVLAGTLALWARHLSAADTMLLHVIAALIAFILGALLLRHVAPPGIRAIHADFDASTEWRKSILPLSLLYGVQALGGQIGVLILGTTHPPQVVAYYKIAVSAATLSLFGLQTANLVATPFFARLYSIGDITRLQRLASMAAMAATLITLPVFGIFFLYGDSIIEYAYGSGFEKALYPLLILCSGSFIGALFGSAGAILNMTGHERDTLRLLVVTTLVNLILTLVLVPRIGINGAAIASAGANALLSVGLWLEVKRLTTVDASIFAVRFSLNRFRNFVRTLFL